MAPIRILCVCVGNHDRSPLIEGVLQQALEDNDINDVVVESCGIKDDVRTFKPYPGASKNSVAVAAENGIDITRHVRRHVSEVGPLDEFDRIVAVNPLVAARLVDLGALAERIYVVREAEGGLADPHGKDMPAFDACLAEIRAERDQMFGTLIDFAD